MAINRLEVLASIKGARSVRRNIAGIGHSARGAQGSVQLLRRTLGLLATGAVLGRLRTLADSFTLIQNRLAIVTKSTAELSVVTDRLFDVANATRTSFQLTSEIYTRTALATRELGRSQEELIQFTETLNKAVILSGAGVLEAQNAMIQLSQGLSSNTLRGDELRSVLEQLPVVADAIADHFDTTRGGLRALGEQNKITAKDILDAFKEVREEIDQRFSKTVPTIAQSFTILKNNFVKLIGVFDKSTGVLQLLAKSIQWVAFNLEEVVRAAGAAAIAIGITLAVGAIGKLTVALGTLTVAALTNPFTTMLVAIASVIGALVAFGDRMEFTKTGIATALDAIVVGFEHLAVFARDSLEALILSITGVQEALTDIDFLEVAKTIVVAVEIMTASFAGLRAYTVEIFSDIPGLIGDIVAKTLEKIANWIIDLTNLIRRLNGEVEMWEQVEFTTPTLAAADKAGFEAFTAAFDPEGALLKLDAFAAEVEKRAQDRFKAEKERRKAREKALADLSKPGPDLTKGPRESKAFQDILRDLEREAELLGLSNRERELRNRLLEFGDDLERAGIALGEGPGSIQEELDGLIQRNAALQDQADIMDEVNGPLEDYIANLNALRVLQEKGAISQDEFNKRVREGRIELLENSRDDFDGYERGFLKVMETMTDFATQAESVITSAFGALEDGIVNLVKTGEFNFKALVDTILEQLTRLLFNQLLMSLLNIAGGGGGAAGAAAAGARTGANFVVGGTGGVDSQMVAFKASPGERVSVDTPAQQRAGGNNAAQDSGGGVAPVVNIKNVNVIDPGMVLDAVATNAGERAILNVIERNGPAVRRLLSR